MAQVKSQRISTYKNIPQEHTLNWTFGLRGFSYVKVIFLMQKLMRFFIAWKVLSTVCPYPSGHTGGCTVEVFRSTSRYEVRCNTCLWVSQGNPKQEGSCCIAIVCCTVMHHKLYTDLTLECANTYRHSQDDMVTKI